MANKRNFGEYTVPTSWEDLTLAKYQEIERYYAEHSGTTDIISILHILTDKTEEEIRELPAEVAELLLSKMAFLNEAPEYEPSNKIEIDGETYMVNTMEKLKTGEYVSFQTAMKNDIHDYASMLAILCRKEGEAYNSEYEANLFEQRREMFLKQPIVKILPITAFFLELWTISELPTLLSSVVEEEINLTQKNIETFRANGRLSVLSTLWLKRKLNRLRKSIKRI